MPMRKMPLMPAATASPPDGAGIRRHASIAPPAAASCRAMSARRHERLQLTPAFAPSRRATPPAYANERCDDFSPPLPPQRACADAALRRCRHFAAAADYGATPRHYVAAYALAAIAADERAARLMPRRQRAAADTLRHAGHDAPSVTPLIYASRVQRAAAIRRACRRRRRCRHRLVMQRAAALPRDARCRTAPLRYAAAILLRLTQRCAPAPMRRYIARLPADIERH